MELKIIMLALRKQGSGACRGGFDLCPCARTESRLREKELGMQMPDFVSIRNCEVVSFVGVTENSNRGVSIRN
jgi:hypothetical protein